ncbi:hypothetical protein HD554DRAFT_1414254 [Boletus coccyginus]|nr:hypothetical protein HD554DRAFT_1414254 [Boletus coccyginus]
MSGNVTLLLFLWFCLPPIQALTLGQCCREVLSRSVLRGRDHDRPNGNLLWASYDSAHLFLPIGDCWGLERLPCYQLMSCSPWLTIYSTRNFPILHVSRNIFLCGARFPS